MISGGSVGGIQNEAASVFTNPGTQDVHLRVTAIGNTYSVFVNGSPTPATTLNDATLASGRVGLYDFSTQTFDNVVVYIIPEPTTTALFFLAISIAALRSHRHRR